MIDATRAAADGQGKAGAEPAACVTIIVARARNGVIGSENALPWRLPEDLQFFKRTTSGHPLIMGRRTFESIGRPLPGRRTIVVTRDQHWSRPGCETASSVRAAIRRAATRRADDDPIDGTEIFVAGGSQIYAEAIGIADRLLVTEIELAPDGDAYFESIDPHEWEEAARERRTSANGIEYAFVEYRRRGRDG